MDDGYVDATAANRPFVNRDMIASYYLSNMEIIRERYEQLMAEGDSRRITNAIIANVRVKRIGPMCIAKAKVTPSVAEPTFNCTIVFDEEDQVIISCKCDDCDSSEACLHSMAFLSWLHCRSNDPDATRPRETPRQPSIETLMINELMRNLQNQVFTPGAA